jgi:hypothetical protein
VNYDRKQVNIYDQCYEGLGRGGIHRGRHGVAYEPLPSEGHGAEGQGGDEQTRASEATILHRILPTWLDE